MPEPHPSNLERAGAQLESARLLLNQLRGSIALQRSENSASDGRHAQFSAIDQIARELTEIRKTVSSLRRDLAHLDARAENAEREAAEQKAKRADAAARIRERDRRLAEIQQSAIWKAVKPLWKLTRSRQLSATAGERDELAFGLDLPKQWRTGRDVLLIKGWCLSRSGRELAGIRAKIGKKSKLGRYGTERPDICEMFGGDLSARRAGFTIELPVPAGRSEVTLEAIPLGGEWQPFFQHELIREAAEDGSGDAEPTIKARPGSTKLRRYPAIGARDAVELLRPRFAAHADRERGAPVFSVITATFNTTPEWFTEAAVSLLDQAFSDWEWCVADDGSTNRETSKLLDGLRELSPRLRILSGEKSGISATSNTALAEARGDYVCFLDHDDLLDAAALALLRDEVARAWDVIYSDEDKLDDKSGKLIEPFFKPDWSPEYLRGAMYVGHLLCVRRELAQKVRFDPQFDGVQDFEFMLRVSETGARIGHIPQILYHWRKTPGSIAERTDAKGEIGQLQARAVNAHLKRLSLHAHAQPSKLPHRLEMIPDAREYSPLVSILIPTKDAPELLGRCLQSIRTKTSYPAYEILVIDNGSTDAEALRLMRDYATRVVPFPGSFNFSRANNLGARAAKGEFLVLLNNDTEIVTSNWLEHLLYYAAQPDVGAAGALLVYDDRTVQHGGVALGIRGTADHLMRGFPLDADGYAGSLVCAREVSAVTAACMMIRKSLFDEIGGLNEHFFTAYQDLDLCLRLRARGLRIVYTPRAVVIHHEWTSRKTYYDMVDRMLLLDQWEPVIERGDPYYHRELNLEKGDYSLANS